MSCSLHDASKACTKLCSRLFVQSKTVPPADGEPEVVAWRSSDAFGAVYAYEPDRHPREYHGLITLESHREHVTRLQAEVERLKSMSTDPFDRMRDLQSELTKARELFNHLYTNNQLSLADDERIENFLSNQSAPADKGRYES